MDPQEALNRLRELTRTILNDPHLRITPDADLASLFDALDEWIMHGGMLPLDWHVAQALKLSYLSRSHRTA